MNKIILLFVSCLFLFGINNLSISQSITYSPYSMFGIGELEQGDPGRFSGLGNVGIGIKSNQSLSRMNPASYTGLDSLSFTFDATFSGRLSDYTNGNEWQENWMGNLKKLAFGFRVTPFWATSIGFVPFSSMGYSISKVKSFEGSSLSYEDKFTGSGSVNKLYLGNAISLTKHLSFGANINYIFGTFVKKEEVLSDYFSTTNYISSENYVHNFNLDFGLQYSNTIGSDENFKYTLGAVYAYKNQLRVNHDEFVYQSGTEVDLTEDDYLGHFDLPMSYGGGFSITHKSGLMLAADFYKQNWSKLESSDDAVKYVDDNRYSVGLEYRPNVRIPKSYFQRMYYQVGATYDETYMKIRGQQIKDSYVSAGLVCPIKSDLSYFCLSFQAGQKGKAGNDLFLERYYQVNFSIIFRDIWFLERKYE